MTVADHAGVGLELDEVTPSGISLVNSIVFGNGTDIATLGFPVIFPANLVGIDPLFTNAAGGDYTLAAGSPAEDAGDTVFSGIGPYDLALRRATRRRRDRPRRLRARRALQRRFRDGEHRGLELVAGGR